MQTMTTRNPSENSKNRECSSTKTETLNLVVVLAESRDLETSRCLRMLRSAPSGASQKCRSSKEQEVQLLRVRN